MSEITDRNPACRRRESKAAGCKADLAKAGPLAEFLAKGREDSDPRGKTSSPAPPPKSPPCEKAWKAGFLQLHCEPNPHLQCPETPVLLTKSYISGIGDND